MSKQRFTNTLSSRSPLLKREAVVPVNMYTSREGDKSASPQTNSPTPLPAQQAASPLPHSQESGQGAISERPQVGKYTTHLRHETIKAIKQRALDTDRSDYEIVQEALDMFLRYSKEK